MRVDGLDRGPAYVVGLRDFAAMIVQPVEDGTWSSVLYGIEGETLATWLQQRRRWHALHHHGSGTRCYGVSTAFWDRRFGSGP